MPEFTSEIKRPGRPVTLYLTLAVAAVAVIAVILLARYQRDNPTKVAGIPVIVTGMVRSGDNDFEAYKDKVRIEAVKAYINISFAGTRSATIEGIISNEGSRKLEAVEMHLTLYDVYGKLSKEKTAIPLRPGVGLNKEPMEPLEKRTFVVAVDSVEQLWNPKRVEIEITGLKYR
jgi:hypothetical protein